MIGLFLAGCVFCLSHEKVVHKKIPGVLSEKLKLVIIGGEDSMKSIPIYGP